MRASALGLLLLVGCIDHLLEAPYVLATGVGADALSLSPTADRSLLVAGPGGVFRVDGSGVVTPVHDGPIRGAVAHARFVALVDDAGLSFGPPQGSGFTATHRVALAGVVSAQAWCEDQVLALAEGALWLASPDRPEATRWATAPRDGIAVAFGPTPRCDAALVLSPDRLRAVDPGGQRLLAEGLEQATAVGMDRTGALWVVHQERPVLARIQDGRPVTVARHLAPTTDLHFGTGDLLHPDNAYLLTRQGTVDYVRIPSPAP
ncbi:hypothetical protein L6R53_24610 [Myxococcota bacterium]|nr:hypothetical protein [Myxococcota bacterium]